MLHSDEVIFCVDKDNSPIDSQTKAYAHKYGIWHRTSQVWVHDVHSRILCHLRSAQVHKAKNKWDPNFGGHAKAGDNAITTARIELKEESGLEVVEESLHHILDYRCDISKEYISVFGLEWNGDIKKIDFQKEEVTKVKWISLEDVEKIYLSEDKTWTQVGYELNAISHLKKY